MLRSTSYLSFTVLLIQKSIRLNSIINVFSCVFIITMIMAIYLLKERTFKGTDFESNVIAYFVSSWSALNDFVIKVSHKCDKRHSYHVKNDYIYIYIYIYKAISVIMIFNILLTVDCISYSNLNHHS